MVLSLWFEGARHHRLCSPCSQQQYGVPHRPPHGRMDDPAVPQRPSSGWRFSLSRPWSWRYLRAGRGL